MLFRSPFTKLKELQRFKEDVNGKMKDLYKIMRRRLGDNTLSETNMIVDALLNRFDEMLDYCDRRCDEENGKMSIVYNSCNFEKVTLRRKALEQPLGLYLISLLDGVHTVGEIARDVNLNF
jgi:hypothetical protein